MFNASFAGFLDGGFGILIKDIIIFLILKG